MHGHLARRGGGQQIAAGGGGAAAATAAAAEPEPGRRGADQVVPRGRSVKVQSDTVIM